MQKAEPQQATVQNQPVSQQRGGVVAETPQAEQIAQLEAMVAASSHQVALQKMVDGMHNSPRQRAAQNFSEGINNSPMMVAQRMRHEQMFGVAQRVEDEESLQVKSSIVQCVKINGESKPDGLLAYKIGGDRYGEKLAIIRSLGDENFDSIELLSERVSSLLPAAPEVAAVVPEASWRDRAPKGPAAPEPLAGLGEYAIGKDIYKIEAHRHQTELTFHLKYDCGTKYVNLFYSQEGVPSEGNTPERVVNALDTTKTQAGKLIKQANAIASDYLPAIQQALKFV